MAFLRFNRDKRGYEHFYLIQPTSRRGKSASRVLYWFRTPPNVKIGREPFDEGVRRALEMQNPDVAFDWRKILETPIPSADAEKWRDRRRAERAARQASARQAAEAGDLEIETPLDAPIPVVEAATAEASSSERVEGPKPSEPTGVKRRRRRRGRRGRPAAPPAAGAGAPVVEKGEERPVKRTGSDV